MKVRRILRRVFTFGFSIFYIGSTFLGETQMALAFAQEGEVVIEDPTEEVAVPEIDEATLEALVNEIVNAQSLDEEDDPIVEGEPAEEGEDEDEAPAEDGETPAEEQPTEEGEDPVEGEDSAEDEQQPAEGEDSAEEEEQPAEGEDPAEEEEQPVEGEDSAEDEQQPAEGEDSAEDEQQPAEGEDPAEEEEQPAEGEDPAEEEQQPAEGENPAEEEQQPAEPKRIWKTSFFVVNRDELNQISEEVTSSVASTANLDVNYEWVRMNTTGNAFSKLVDDSKGNIDLLNQLTSQATITKTYIPAEYAGNVSITEYLGANKGYSESGKETLVEDIIGSKKIETIVHYYSEKNGSEYTGNLIYATSNEIDWYVYKDAKDSRGWHVDGFYDVAKVYVADQYKQFGVSSSYEYDGTDKLSDVNSVVYTKTGAADDTLPGNFIITGIKYYDADGNEVSEMVEEGTYKAVVSVKYVYSVTNLDFYHNFYYDSNVFTVDFPVAISKTNPEPIPGGDEPEPGPGGDEPTPGPGGDEPEPGPGGDEPEPGPGGDEPEPGPGGDEPEPGPGGDEPTPGPGGDEPTPGPGGDEPTPGPGGDEPEPGPGGDEPEPGPGGDEPEPGPGGDEPTPGPGGDEPTPGPGGDEPTPGPTPGPTPTPTPGPEEQEIEDTPVPLTPVVPGTPAPTPTEPAEETTPTEVTTVITTETPEEEEVEEVSEPEEVIERLETDITDGKAPLSGLNIADDETPLAAHGDCWIHWLILILTVVDALYTVIQAIRNGKKIKDLEKKEA